MSLMSDISDIADILNEYQSKIENLERRVKELEREKRDLEDGSVRKTFSYDEAAEILSIERKTLKRRVHSGKIRAHSRDTQNPFIYREDLIQYLVESGSFREDAERIVR